MLVLFLLVMGEAKLPGAAHEWLGIALFALFFAFTVLVATADKAAGKVPGTEIGLSHLNLAFFNATHKNGEIKRGITPESNKEITK